MIRSLACVLLWAGCVRGAPAVSGNVNEGGVGGVRSAGGAVITVAGADWSAGGTSAAGKVRIALDGMSGVHVGGCGPSACPTPPVPTPWGCVFNLPTSTLPSNVVCTVQSDTYDIFAQVQYTLAPWTDDGGNTWSSTSFAIYPTKGTAHLAVSFAGTPPFPPLTQVITVPSSGSYPGGTATVPTLIYTEEDIRAGETVQVALRGETWNAGTYKTAVPNWLTEVTFATVVNPSTPINPDGFEALKSVIFPSDAAYAFSAMWSTTGNDIITATMSPSVYDVPQHEVISVTITNEAVTSSAPAGAPDTSTLRFEIWPVNGYINVSTTSLTFSEEEVRAGLVSFDLVVSSDKWDPSMNWEIVRDGLGSDITPMQEPNGWQARRSFALPDPANIVRKSDNIVTVTLTADPGYDISLTETLTLDLPGCVEYRMIRVLPVGTLCTSEYVMKSQLKPVTASIELRVLPTPGTLTVSPDILTECDVRDGTTITLALMDDFWNFDDMAAVQAKMYELLVSDVPTTARPAGEPAGFNALKSFLTSAAKVTLDGTNRVLTVQLGPSTAYDVVQNETLSIGDRIYVDAGSGVLFRSGLKPVMPYNSSVVILPGPCHEVVAAMTCAASACTEFQETDIRQGQASITLTLPFGEEWSVDTILQADLYDIAWASTSTSGTRVRYGSPDDRSGSAAAVAGSSLPWGFLARLNASMGVPQNSIPRALVNLKTLDSQRIAFTFSDEDYDISFDETVTMWLPASFTVSGVPPKPVSFTVNYVRPTVTLEPAVVEFYNCDIQGPLYKYGSPTPLGTGYTYVRGGAQCASASTDLGASTSLQQCAQKCHERVGCDYFIFGTGASYGSCFMESTSSKLCSEGFVADNYDFYSLDMDLQIRLDLEPGTWAVTGDDVRSMFQPWWSEFVQHLPFTLPEENMILPSNNTLILKLRADPTLTLPNGDELITLNVHPHTLACDCIPSPALFTFMLRRCPGVVYAEDFSFEERDVWEGSASVSLRLEGDTWNSTVGWEFKDWFYPAGVADPMWAASVDCVFKALPTVVGDTLTIPLGPCPTFDINTDVFGNLGVFSPMDNATVFFAVNGDLTQSGTAPVGGNEVGFRASSPEARVYMNISSSQGTVRVTPKTPFYETDVHAGLYAVTLTLDAGETFANPNGLQLSEYIRLRTRSQDSQPNGFGWEFLSTVLIDKVTINPTDPHIMTITWKANPNYNIHRGEYLCIEIDELLTASGLRPKSEDGSYCVAPPPVLPQSGCVSMEPYPYTVSEEEIRTKGIEFDLVLSNNEVWLTGGLDQLLENMTVVDANGNMLGWERRKGAYSSAAFRLDSTRTRLTVRIPGDGAGNPVPDTLFDIVESEVVEITVPETIVGSRKPPCVTTPAGGPLWFNITAIEGSVHMVETVFTESEIRTGGASVVVTIVGDTWASPWTNTEKEMLRSNLVTVCSYDTDPADWGTLGRPYVASTPRCNYNSGFDVHRDDPYEPIVNLTLLQYNNDKLEIILNPTAGYDIPEDEVIVIDLPAGITATGNTPANWDKLWFIIKASKSMLANTGGVINPGISDEDIRKGTAPPVRVNLVYETWDVTEDSRFKVGFCGAGGDCSDVGNPYGFNAMKDDLFPLTVAYEDDSGRACPPYCPATVAVFRFRPVPEFDVCNGWSEEVIVSLDPLTVTSHPLTQPTPWGINSPDILGFNITGGDGPGLSIKVEMNLIPGGGPYLINEELIRQGGLAVTLSVSDGSWDIAQPNFVEMLRDSVVSSLPPTEVFSHAGPLVSELMPDAFDELFFYSDTSVSNRHMVFNISSWRYDIPSSTPKQCYVTSCPWLASTTTVNTFECGDLTMCNGITHPQGMGCCNTNQGIRRCPLNWPYMCRDQSCFGGYCCVDRPDACLNLGGPRPCGTANCILDEAIRFDIPPEMTTCRMVHNNNLEVRIEGNEWVNANWSTPTTTREALNYSTYVGEPVTILVEGTELHSLNDTAGISYTPGCTPGTIIYGTNITLQAATLPDRANQNPRSAGPGLFAVTLAPLTHIPGIYDVCYKDFRDLEYTRIPVLGAGSTVYPVVTVIGKAFSFEGQGGSDVFNVTQGETTQLSLYGKGFCVGDNIQTNGAGLQSYAHTGLGCDSVKLMVGDVDCNPDYPAVDNLSGRFGQAKALQPALYDEGFPRSFGTVDFELTTAGTYTVCYLSRWASHWQGVGTFNVSAVIYRWDACDPDTYDPGLYHKSMKDSAASPTSNMQQCTVSYTALSGKPQRIFFQGSGLTSTDDQLGQRSRHSLYQQLGNGICKPLDATFIDVTCTATSFMTLWDCQKLCDVSAYCDGVQYTTGSGECVLQLMSDTYQLPNMQCVPVFRTHAVRPRGSLRVASGPFGTMCFNKTENKDPTDVGDKAKVIRHGDSCEYASGPEPGALSPNTPAIQYVNGDPYGADWDTTSDTCTWHTSASRCQTKDTNVVWNFFKYGRYTLCYQFYGTDEWVQVPETHLIVNAEVVRISPTQRIASQDPPVVWYIGRGITYDIVEARVREWPATCDSPPGHPGVLGYGWEEDRVLSSGELILTGNQFDNMARTNWTFDHVGSDSGGVPVASLPHWWSMAGMYLFCYRIPGLTGWLPIDYFQVIPEATGVSPEALQASPHPQTVNVHGAGMDSRMGMDTVKFVPAVSGTCNQHDDSAFIIMSPEVGPRQTGIGHTGDGIRGLTTLTAEEQTFGTPGLYRVCYGWQNETDVTQERRCNAYGGCGAFSGNCCPTDDGVWLDCCGRGEPSYYDELAVGGPCLTTNSYPPSWPAWYVNRLSQCVLKDDVPARGRPWFNEPEPPCPDFYCGLLAVTPLVGGMIVEDHTTAFDPPILEVGLDYRIRFDGQGFSENDTIYIVEGFQSDCDTVEPSTTLAARMAVYPATPGTPWNGVKRGLPRGLWNASFPDTGDFTICLSFQYYPGLYMPAGNLTVRNTIASMSWTVDASQNLKVDFQGGGLSPQQDQAMIIPSTSTSCNGTGPHVTNQLKGTSVVTTWDVSVPLANGVYHTCYKLAGTDQWIRLGGIIQVPFGNVQPAFDIISTPSIFGPPDNLHLYGPRGTGLNYSSPFAVGITTAKDGLDWLPREKNQTLQFKIISTTYNKGGSSLFESKCVSLDSHCFVTPLNGNETRCTMSSECEWVNSQCSATTMSLCRQKRSPDSCARSNCRWSLGQPPTFNEETGYLSFQVGDAEEIGSLKLEVVLVDSGGVVFDGNNVSESRTVSITITSGPEFTSVTPTITLNEDEPQFDMAIIAWSVSRIQGREYAFNVIWDDVNALSYFSEFTIKDKGALDVVPAPDRSVLFPGLNFTVQLWDLTVGASFRERFSIVIYPVNDPPYFEMVPAYTLSPVYWRQGRSDPFTERVVIIPPSTEQCRTFEGMMCIRTYVAGGCSGELPADLAYPCLPYASCASAKCAAIMSNPIENQQCLLPDQRVCAVDSVNNGCVEDINCKGCQTLACLSAPNSSFTLGRGESHQSLRSFSAFTEPPDAVSSFLVPPAVDIDGVLSFALLPSAVGIFEIIVSVTDNGGNASGGSSVFSSPDRVIVKTFFLPTLEVTPATGGIALETAFRMEAKGGEENSQNWRYTFTTLPGVQDLPVDLSGGWPISHSLNGPHAERMIITSDIPPGDHTVILHIYDGDTLVDTAQKFISVNSPTSVRLAEALQRGITLSQNKTQDIMPLLASIGASLSSIGEAQGQGTTLSLAAAIRDAAANLQSPTGVVHTNVIMTALSSLSTAMTTTVDSGTLLVASDAFDNIKAKATGDGVVHGYVTLKGMSLVGLNEDQKKMLEASLVRDLASSYSVVEGTMELSLQQTDTALVANYTIASTPADAPTVHASIVNTHKNNGVTTTNVESTYKTLRLNSPNVWYEASHTATSARGTLGLNDLNVGTLSEVKKELLLEQLQADLADSFGVPMNRVYVTLTELEAGGSGADFTIDTNDDPATANIIKCSLIPACEGNEVTLSRSPYGLNLSRSTYSFDTAGDIALPDLDFSVISQDKTEDIQAAIRQDIAAMYGVPLEAVSQVFEVDARTGGTIAKHRVGMTDVSNPGQVQGAMKNKIATRTLQLTKTVNTLSSLVATVIGEESGSPAIVSATPDDAMVQYFVKSAAAVLMSAPNEPQVWNSSQQQAAAEGGSQERARVNFALGKQLGSMYDVIDIHCTDLLQGVIASGVDSRIIRVVTKAFTTEWLAVSTAGGPLTSVLPHPKGDVSIINDRPSATTCITATVYTKSAFLSDGEPGRTPQLPVTSVLGGSLSDTTVTLPISQSKDIGMIVWNTEDKWQAPRSGGLEILSSDSSKGVMRYSGSSRVLSRQASVLQSDTSREERVMATSVQGQEKSSLCLACILLPILFGLWGLLTIAGIVLHEEHLDLQVDLDDDAKLLHTFNREPTFFLMLFKHHAWLCYFPVRPTLIQYYTRSERATVWFSVYFIATGLVSFFFSADGVKAWEQPPSIDYSEGVAIGLLCAVVGFVVSLGLRYFLMERERNWRAHAEDEQLVIPDVLEEADQDDLGHGNPKEKKSGVRLAYYFFAFASSVTMVVLFVTFTDDYNTSAQVEQYVFAFCMAIAWHFVLEFFWVMVMYKLETMYWKAPDHPRHSLFEPVEKPTVILPSFHTGEVPIKHPPLPRRLPPRAQPQVHPQHQLYETQLGDDDNIDERDLVEYPDVDVDVGGGSVEKGEESDIAVGVNWDVIAAERPLSGKKLGPNTEPPSALPPSTTSPRNFRQTGHGPLSNPYHAPSINHTAAPTTPGTNPLFSQGRGRAAPSHSSHNTPTFSREDSFYH